MKYKAKYIQIACDGGASTGKSTAAKLISKKAINKSGIIFETLLFILLKGVKTSHIEDTSKNKKWKNKSIHM